MPIISDFRFYSLSPWFCVIFGLLRSPIVVVSLQLSFKICLYGLECPDQPTTCLTTVLSDTGKWEVSFMSRHHAGKCVSCRRSVVIRDIGTSYLTRCTCWMRFAPKHQRRSLLFFLSKFILLWILDFQWLFRHWILAILYPDFLGRGILGILDLE